MDYVVGGVAALISGNVTPNRPKALKRALTPMKHQPSPNVTPKSESVVDRSIFLSPTMQKKKAIVKKSPKRIFQNPDLDATIENDSVSTSSPKAEKVKKHLKDQLDTDTDIVTSVLSLKSPKNKLISPQKKQNTSLSGSVSEEVQASNKIKPKKKKNNLNSFSEDVKDGDELNTNNNNNAEMPIELSTQKKSLKKKKKSNTFTVETIDRSVYEPAETVRESSVEKKNKAKKKISEDTNQGRNLKMDPCLSVNKENEGQGKKNKNKKSKKNVLKNIQKSVDSVDTDNLTNDNKTNFINPNAITNQDTDSEHESDDDIQSENEESNKAVLDTGPQSSDDEEVMDKKEKKSGNENIQKEHVETQEEVERTLFVGNVPFSSKCKKEIKRIFSKYGTIETVRIRTIPVKDGRVTPKLAIIKNELHPERSTVNVYIKFANPSAVNDALVENNTVLNGHHLRVARSNVTGSEHDPKCSVFVGNIPFALEEEALRAKFSNCGEIESVRIVRDRKTNAGKGFGYVNFASKDGVELALALTEEDLTLKNRILRVKRCTQPTTNKLAKQQNKQFKENNQGRQHGYQRRPQNPGRQFNNFRGANGREPQVKRFGNNKFGNDTFQRRDQSADAKTEGAYRRIMKRKAQENTEGPLEKRQKNLNQPNKEKKPRKEFVGITADKKKFQKRKLNKDQKKKKALGEILTKRHQ